MTLLSSTNLDLLYKEGSGYTFALFRLRRCTTADSVDLSSVFYRVDVASAAVLGSVAGSGSTHAGDMAISGTTVSSTTAPFVGMGTQALYIMVYGAGV